MTRLNNFLGDDHGAVTIDWVALTAGILLLGIMIVYAIFNGGVAGIVTSINATLTDVAASVDTGATPDLNGIEVASGGPMVLFDREVPVGSDVVVFNTSPFSSQIRIIDSDGTMIISFGGASGAFDQLQGATVSSATTFTLSDKTTVVQASDFFPPT